MDNDTDTSFSLVYRGFDPVLAGMLQRMLEADGIICRHVGTHYPAEVGVGAYGCEQRLEVPEAAAERALELIASATADEEEETQAEIAPQ